MPLIALEYFQLEKIQEIYKKAFLECHLFFNLFMLRLFQSSTVESFLLSQVYPLNVVQNIDAFLNLFLCSINDLNANCNMYRQFHTL